MKPLVLAATVAVALVSIPALAESGHRGDMAMTEHAASTAPAQPVSEGTVKKIDHAAGKLTITHGPLTNLGMPGMTMVFRAKDAAMLERVKEGDKIRFTADRMDGAFTVVALEPMK